MTIILLKGHPKERLPSMELFHDMLHVGLGARGVHCVTVAPPVFFSRLVKDAKGWGRFFVYLDKFLLFPYFLRKAIGRCRNDRHHDCIVHIVDHGNALYTAFLQDIAHLVTCHDGFGIRSAFGLEPLNKRVGPLSRIYQKQILSGLKKSLLVACVSNFTRLQITDLGVKGSHCRVVSNGLNYPYMPMSNGKAQEILSVSFSTRQICSPSTGYILHLGGNSWYKNRRGVILSYARLVEECPEVPALILAGRPLSTELLSLIKEKNLANYVYQFPDCTSEELNALYQEARFLFFPSVREGFGWPIIEAQASGGLVITSDREPMNDVGGDAAIYCEPPPIDGQDLDRWATRVVAQTLIPVLEMTPETRGLCIQRGFENAARYSVETMISAYEKLYRECLEEMI